MLCFFRLGEELTKTLVSSFDFHAVDQKL